MAVATDGPCSSDNFNMFEALRAAALLQTSNQVDYREWLSDAGFVDITSMSTGGRMVTRVIDARR